MTENPKGKMAKHGTILPHAVYGVDLDEQRWFPVQSKAGGIVISGDHGIFEQDGITGGMMTIGTFHHEIHEGDTYIVSHYDAAVANNGTIIFHLTPGPKFTHLIFTGTMGGDTSVELLEDPTITGGAAHAEINLKRTSTNVADTVALLNPVINVDGTLLFEAFIPGGTGGNATGGQFGLRDDTEWILDPNKTYAVRLTNISGLPKDGSLLCEWYEESSDS